MRQFGGKNKEMGKLLDAAIWYRKAGYSVIPVRRNKKPFITWQRYQNIHATEDEIQGWWSKWPEANVGIVTGAISGLTVVDADSEKGREAIFEFLPDTLTLPTCKTPHGYHFYFQFENGIGNGVRVLSDCDVRSNGGYVVAPPSRNSGKQGYQWFEGLRISDVSPAKMPDILVDVLTQVSSGQSNINTNIYNNLGASTREDVNKASTSVNKVNISFEKGNRDNTIFNIANHLVKGGMFTVNIENVIRFIASHCNPPYPEKDIPAKIKSALNRSENRNKNLTNEIREVISSTSGNFSSTFIYETSTSSTLPPPKERRKISAILSRFVAEGFIERVGSQNGIFRRVEKECEAMDFINCKSETVGLWLPFSLNKMVELMPGNIVVIAGSPNAGKTALLLDVVRNNQARFEVHYFNSEMGSSELKKRLEKFEDIQLNEWRFYAWERSDNFADVIKPGKGVINIIDFLEIHDNF